MKRRILVLGTRNKKKLGELIELLEPYGFELRSLAAYPTAVEVEESGDTFAANAALKGTVQAQQLGEWVLGEDSGLCVDALQGRPGVYSARFAGQNADDAMNNRKLLDELANYPLEKRRAHYVCHATLSDPQGVIRAESEGNCYGRILPKEAGSGGFGYDPLFEIPEYHRTFGELTPAVKSVLSHRARAMRLLLPQLIRLTRANAWPAQS
jgi:XTP/dITP diphosphohydrolase